MADPLHPYVPPMVAYGASYGASQAMGHAGHTPGMFAGSGPERDPRSVRSQLSGLDRLTGGGLSFLSGGQMEQYIRKAHAMASQSSGGTAGYVQRVDYGVQLANQAGLNSTFGASTAYNSTAFGEAFGKLGGNQGYGGLSKEEATGLDQQLRTSAAGSPMANALGSLMAMHENNLIKGGGAAEIVKAIESRDPAKMAALAKMSPSQLMQMLKTSGVDPATAQTFMQSKKANQEQIAKYSIGDLTRGMQRDGEVKDFMTNNMAGSMAGSLARSGFDRGSAQMFAGIASEAARQALMNMDPETLNNPSKRNAAVATAVKGAIGDEAAAQLRPEKLNELVATSIRSLEGAMGRNRNFGKFKNLQGLISMNRGDVQSEANAQMVKSKADAEVASVTSGMGGGGLSKAVDAALGAGDDTKLTEVISSALGGTNSGKIAAAISPQMKSLRENAAEIKELQGQMAKTSDPAQKAEIQAQIEQVKEKSKGTFQSIQATAKAANIKAAAESAPTPGAAAGPDALASGLAGGGGGGGRTGPLQITGTLVVKADGTADIDAGTNRAGDAPAP